MSRAPVIVAFVTAALVTLGVPATGAGADEHASCTGLAVSSLAGQPGIVAALTREFHDFYKDVLGLPPGAFDSSFAKRHDGSVEDCIS